MAGWYVVNQGDCLSSLARQFRLANWKKVYNCPENADFRQLRPDPNVILPGDRVFIPDRETSEDPAATDKRHKYLLKRDPTRLRIVLADEDGQPYKDCRYKLRISASEFEGTTDSEGLIEEVIDATAETGELMVWWDQARTLHCRWTLKIGHLDPVENVAGVQGRLNNLAFDSGPVDGIDGPLTKRAVKRFQVEYGLTVDGIAGPITKGKLKEVHGC